MLKIKGLTKSFGKFKALDNLDLNIEEGLLYGLVGRNGAGKTTAMKIITGLMYFDKGEVFIDGHDINKEQKLIKNILAYIPDGFSAYDNMTVSEYMNFFAGVYDMSGFSANNRCINLLKQVGLGDRIKQNISELSRGMQQRLSLARALIHDPKFILMDEPSSGLDPVARHEFKETLKELRASGKTILLSSHMLSELSEICTDIGIIDAGKMLISGKIDDILDEIERSNPIKITILDNEKAALTIFKNNDKVRSISLYEKTFMIQFLGNKKDEAKLLQELINNGISVLSFVREQGNLESFFIQATLKDKERVIFSNDY